MKLMVDKKDVVKIIVYCWENEGEVEASHEKSEIPKDTGSEEVEFSFRKPGYGDSNAIMKKAGLKVDGDETNLDAAAFQDQVLRTLLVKWNLKNGDNAVPVNQSGIDNLIPAVGRAAVSGVMEKIRF